MILVFETVDEQAVKALVEVAKALRVSVHVEPNEDALSKNEQKRRLSIIRKFKGGLMQFSEGGYQVSKTEWYKQ